jgi:hypothetical protein
MHRLDEAGDVRPGGEFPQEEGEFVGMPGYLPQDQLLVRRRHLDRGGLLGRQEKGAPLAVGQFAHGQPGHRHGLPAVDFKVQALPGGEEHRPVGGVPGQGQEEVAQAGFFGGLHLRQGFAVVQDQEQPLPGEGLGQAAGRQQGVGGGFLAQGLGQLGRAAEAQKLGHLLQQSAGAGLVPQVQPDGARHRQVGVGMAHQPLRGLQRKEGLSQAPQAVNPHDFLAPPPQGFHPVHEGVAPHFPAGEDRAVQGDVVVPSGSLPEGRGFLPDGLGRRRGTGQVQKLKKGLAQGPGFFRRQSQLPLPVLGKQGAPALDDGPGHLGPAQEEAEKGVAEETAVHVEDGGSGCR